MIKAIIFDCFGVLVTDGWFPFKDEHFGHDPKLMARASELNQQANAGLITYRQFMDEIAALAGVSTTDFENILRANVVNEPLLRYIKSLKLHYKIGFLSNSASDHLKRMFSDEQIALFDAVVLSYQVGMAKPDPRIYAVTAQKLGLAPNECIFVDDQESYVRAAKEMGMPSVYYQSFKQAKADLEQILAK